MLYFHIVIELTIEIPVFEMFLSTRELANIYLLIWAAIYRT